MRERDRELAVERRQIALILGFTSDGRRDHSVDGFSQSERSRERLLRPLWVQHRLTGEALPISRREQTSLTPPVEQVLIGTEVLVRAIGKTPTHGVDEVQARDAAPKLEPPSSPVTNHTYPCLRQPLRSSNECNSS